MAGIGFELKKLFVGRGAIQKLRAYAYASVISAGTMILAFVLLIAVQFLSKAFGATQHESDVTTVMMVYAIGGSLVLGSVFQMLLTRFVADQIYTNQGDRVIPSLFGGAVILIVPGALLYGALLVRAEGIQPVDKLLGLALFLELTMVWLQMAYITVAKNYKRVIYGFAAGVAVSIVFMWTLLSTGWPILTSVLLALFLGYGVMMVLFLRVLLDYFPVGRGSLFYFVGWIGRYKELVPTGMFLVIGAYAHLVLMWFGPIGDTVAGVFRFAPLNDSPAFYAFLVTVPSSINFVVSVEVNFYEKYRDYFAEITGGGTLKKIDAARSDMVQMLNQEVVNLSQIQAFVMVVYAVLMRYFLETIGFTREMIATFQVGCVAYSAYAVGNCLVQLQMYFNDRKGALITSAAFFATNAVVTLFTRNGPPWQYALGILAAGVVMYLVGALRLSYYVRDIDYHVFCGQPILVSQERSMLEKFANYMDRAARRRRGRMQSEHESERGITA